MAKKKSNDGLPSWLLYTLGILFLLMLFILIVKIDDPFSFMNGLIGDKTTTTEEGDTNINVEVVVDKGSESESTDATEGTDDMCSVIQHNYPTGTFIKQLECEAVGGTFDCQADSFGCLDIPMGMFDTTNCGSDIALQLKAYCTTQGGLWTCVETEISCEVA